MRTLLLTTTAGVLICSSTALASIDVLFCQITGHPKALVPRGAGVPAGTEFRVVLTTGFDRPYQSSDGSYIFFTGLANLPTTEDECYVVANLNTNAAFTLAREGTTFGSPTGEVLGLGDQRMGINNSGECVFGIRLNPAVSATDKAVVKWDGSSFTLVAREGGPVPGVPTELWGDSMNSGHILTDGTPIWCGVNTNGPLPGTQDDFCMIGNTIAIQTGQLIDGSAWSAFNVSDFNVSADGAHTMIVGDDSTPAATNRIMVVNGVVVAREGVPLTGSSYTSNVSANFGSSHSILADDGSWMLRGHNVDGHDWVLRNGVVVAEKGAPITPSSTELYDDATFADLFFFIAANNVGDWVVGGVTDADPAANAVLVLNGTTVVVREGDMIDLNGNGLPDDDAFVSIFNNDDGILTNDLKLVFFANCVNGAGTSIGQMVLIKDLAPPTPPCPADINGDGNVNVTDLLAVIGAWGACPPPCPADINNDGDVNVTDLLAVIGAWGACP